MNILGYTHYCPVLSQWKCYITTLGSIGGSSNTKDSVNAVFIPTVDHKGFDTTQQQDLDSPDVVSLREGLGIRDRPMFNKKHIEKHVAHDQ